jgi:hypothetical protein
MRRRREGGRGAGADLGAIAASSPSPPSSHSSQARPWRSLLIKKFRRGIAFRSVLSGAEAATSARIFV